MPTGRPEARVEPDCSQAGYFWAAAAVTASSSGARGHGRFTPGDIRILTFLLEEMGCARGIAGGMGVRAFQAERCPASGTMSTSANIPDAVPTVAVVAAFARGEPSFRNVAHLREKESDRISDRERRSESKWGSRRLRRGQPLDRRRHAAPGGHRLQRPRHRHEFCRRRPESAGVRILDDLCPEIVCAVSGKRSRAGYR